MLVLKGVIGVAATCALLVGCGTAASPSAPTGGAGSTSPPLTSPSGTTPATESSSAPGDDRGTLQADGLLDPQGRLQLVKLAASSTEARRAACTYVFGAVEQVALLARTGPLTLSAPTPARSDGVFCPFSTASLDKAFIIAIGDSAPIVQDLNGGKGGVIIDGTPLTRALAYKSDYNGPTISTADARTWLAASAKKVLAKSG